VAASDFPVFRELGCHQDVDALDEVIALFSVVQKTRKKQWPVNSPQQHVHVQVPTALGFGDAVCSPATAKNAFPKVLRIELTRPVQLCSEQVGQNGPHELIVERHAAGGGSLSQCTARSHVSCGLSPQFLWFPSSAKLA